MQQGIKNNLIQLLKGSMIGIIVMVLAIFSTVLSLYKGGISNGVYMPLLIICAILSGGSGGFFSAKSARKNGLINGILSSIIPGIILFLVISVITTFEPINIALIMIVLAGGASGGILAVNTKIKKRK